ncbi:hypothetical protein K432DRAFT_288720 [Lepidopterella palustris CBS 459.81]|uniref:SP-RING-type domain-containing protein n=1 Tax=Lepidopterella palustris CBS 459.81 TaxID=1314670 RepID=A0A8E2EIC6_9PEZI|nr:hypothetical protein K432DRAFT_288720 [Lepidopterella palustris CBS 459.81]
MTPGRRRAVHPSDSAAAASEFASSNSTLNKFLGGKQKAWMTVGLPPDPLPGPPARRQYSHPSNRANVNPQPHPPADQQPLSATPRFYPHDMSERHAPSNSTSPQLANILSPEREGSSRPLTSNILPSPAPSDDLESANNGRHSTYDNNTEGARLVNHTASIDRAQDRLNGNINISVSMIQARKRTADREPSGEVRKRRQGAQALLEQSHALNAEREHAQNEVTRAQAQTLQLAPHQPVEWTQTRQHFETQARSQQVQPQFHAQLQAQAHPQSQFQAENEAHAHAPKARGQAEASRVAGHSSQPQSPLQSQYSVLNYFTYEDCVNAYQSILRECGGLDKLAVMERQRIGVLRDAIEFRDWSYLSLHQYYCLAMARPDQLPPSLRTLPALPGALQCLGSVLGYNENISSWLLQRFSDFPLPLGQIAVSWPTEYEKQREMFKRFAILSDARFATLRHRWNERKWPPLVRELETELSLFSTTFQDVVFLASLRTFWVNTMAEASPWVAQAQLLFRKNRLEYQLRMAQRSTSAERFEIVEAQNVLADDDYANQLKNLYSSHQHYYMAGQRARINPAPAQSYPQNVRAQSRTNSVSYPTFSASSSHPPNVTAAEAQPLPLQNSSPLAVAQRNQELIPRRGYIFPSPGEARPQPSQPNPHSSALHQAHLRSPILIPERDVASLRPKLLYQYVNGFAISPRLFAHHPPIQTWTFPISGPDFAIVPRDQPGAVGEPLSRAISERSQTYRLRCIKWNSDQMPQESTWVVADTSWVPYAYFKLNGNQLHARKKLHNGKDLPIDITRFVQEGENRLEIAVLRQSNDKTPLDYALAIEIISTKSHVAIKENCSTLNRIPAEQVTSAIKASLSAADRDDEIAVVSSNITINLFDPFSACRMFDIPVRGRTCRHHDCFDLETFLQTRKRKQPMCPSAIDDWKCPLCKADARPQCLIVDGFMEDVRKKLAEKSLLETRAIVMEQDGSWKPKLERLDKNGIQDRDSPDEDEQFARALAQSTLAPQTFRPDQIVIDISD